MEHQDWTPVKISSAKAGLKLATDSERSQAMPNSKKVLEESEIGTFKVLSGKSRSDMAQARVAKGMTQKQLDQRGQFPANSCNSWESGKVCPSGPQINILHRLLGIKLERE
jgi:ribosome-binding protein aMBF1 (putative translation factor)